MTQKTALVIIILIQNLVLNAQKQSNSAEIFHSLQQLATVGSVLYVAAHPDDENTRLIAYMANEKKVRAGYLSITRGDGGQNLIGKEQSALLGLIRTQELLAARKIDGGEQFFTRAIDFGYSKNPQETFEIWNKDSILADVVWTIRKFRPDIIICRFGTDGSGGHGHHTASALIAEEAFELAGDASKYPNQLKYVSTWKPKLLLWNFWVGRHQVKGKITKLDLGGFNPILGQSYDEIAAESRSSHKSQGFGTSKSRGENTEHFSLLKGDCDSLNMFSQTDLSLKRLKGSDKFSKTIAQIITDYNIQKPELSLPNLIKAYKEVALIEDEYWREIKQNQLKTIIEKCTGLFMEAAATDPIAIQGSTIKINLQILNRTQTTIKLEKISIANAKDTTLNKLLEFNKNANYTSSIQITQNQSFTNPYWLTDPANSKGLFAVNNQPLVGRPENESAFNCEFYFDINGTKIIYSKPIIYKWVEPSDGEKYRCLEILPPVTTNLDEKAYLFANKEPRTVKITLKSNADNLQGKLKMQLPDGWTANPIELPFGLTKKGEESVHSFTITGSTSLTGVLKAAVELNGQTYSKSITRINYPHIPMQLILQESEAKLIPLDIQKKGTNIGYISGAGDYVARCLEQVGYKVTLLDDYALTNGNLDGFDAIVTGIRAYNTNERMKIYQPRLMEYVAKGGRLIVQYNTNSWIASIKDNIGPFPYKISNQRVTREEAEMIANNPAHPILNTPNKLTANDFEGWIQERGLYFAADMAPEYESIFSTNDPKEGPLKGSLIVAKYGKGTYIYTGLSFFRQLPAGVPGAYRLFSNLINRP